MLKIFRELRQAHIGLQITAAQFKMIEHLAFQYLAFPDDEYIIRAEIVDAAQELLFIRQIMHEHFEPAPAHAVRTAP